MYQHARQVKEEQSLLAREAQELHSRLLNLSSEKEEYESIINEVKQSISGNHMLLFTSVHKFDNWAGWVSRSQV